MESTLSTTTETKAGESSMEEELWNIFTEYNLRANPLEPPDRMSLGTFRNLAKECKVLTNPNAAADFQLAFSAEVAKQHNTVHKKRSTLGFSGFLEALMRICMKKFPGRPHQEALELVLMEYIIPSAKRRAPIPLQIEDDFAHFWREFEQIRAEFEPSLKELLLPYFHGTSNGFRTGLGRIGASSPSTMTFQTLSYESFMRFAQDFNLLNSGLLTTYQLGEIFLWAADGCMRGGDVLRTIVFGEFWNALVRCALTAFILVEVTPVDKLKGLLTHMWQAIQKSARDEDDAAPINASQNMMHALRFKTKVTQMWQADGYRDYLRPHIVAQPPARLLLKSIPSPNQIRSGSSPNMQRLSGPHETGKEDTETKS